MIKIRDSKGRFIKGHNVPNKWRRAWGEKSAGKQHSEEWKHAISIGNSGKKRTIEQKLRYRNSKLGKKNPNYKKEYTTEERKRWSQYSKKQWENMLPDTKDIRNTKIRKSRLKYIKEVGGPRIGKFEKPVLDFLESYFGFSIIRQYEIGGYFLDGYCPIMNLAIEIDESHHKKMKYLIKDIKREEIICKTLNCSFLRVGV